MEPGGNGARRRAMWVNHFPVFGGPHNWTMLMRDALRERGWDTLAVLPTGESSAADRMRATGMEVVQIPLRRARGGRDPRENLRTLRALPGDVRRLRRLLMEQEVDLVILQGLLNPHGAIAARREDAAIVWQVIDTRTPPLLRRPGMAMVRHYADAVMFCGSALEGIHTGNRPLAVESVPFTPVVDLDLFAADPGHRAAARQSFGVPPEALFVGTVANLNPMKGIEYFVRAAGSIFRTRPDAHFLICGARYDTHRAYLDRIREEIAASGVPEERWHRREGAPHGFYPALDVKLITSVPHSEGTTTTAMEAMACGTPVVATDVGAVTEVVEDGISGLIVPPLDPDAIAAATLRVAGDPQLWQELSRGGRRRAVERYGIEVGADTHARAFEAAMAHARGD